MRYIEIDEILDILAKVINEKIKQNEAERLQELSKLSYADKINPERNKYPRATTAEIYIIVLYIVEPKLRALIKENVTLELFATQFNKRVLNALYSNDKLTEALGEFTQDELIYIGKYFTLVHECARTTACVNEWIEVLKGTKAKKNINLLSDEELTAHFSKMSSEKQSYENLKP